MILPVTRCIFMSIVYLAMTDLVSGLKCFECTLSQPGCENPTKHNISITDCRWSLFTLIPDNLQARMRGTEGDDDFQCLTTIEKNSTNRFFTRRCALKSEQSICELTTRDNYQLEFEKCSLCGKNYCNSSIVHRNNVTYIYLLLVITVVLKINYL